MLRFIFLLLAVTFLYLSIDPISIKPSLKNESFETKNKKELEILFDVSKSISKSFFTESKKYLNTLSENFDLTLNLFTNSNNINKLAYANDLELEKLQANFNDLELNKTSFKKLLNLKDKNVILISDGFFNLDFNLDSLVKNSALKINVFIPKNLISENLSLTNFSAPKLIAPKTSFNLKVEVANNSNFAKNSTLNIYHLDKLIKTFNINLKSKTKFYRKVKIESLLTKKDFFRAEFITSNNTSNKLLYVNEESLSKLLILSRLKKEEAPLKELLINTGYSVDSFLNSQVKSTLNFKKYDLVIYNNVHKNELPYIFQSKIKSYVSYGGKFLMLGGNKSFGLGGYKNTEIEEVLPVLMEEPKKKQKRLNLAVQLLIDKSESMKYGQKLDYAKLAAREVIKNLKDEDYFGLIGFEDNPFFAMRMAKLDKNRERAISRVGLLFPAGGTQLLPALDRARRELQKVNSGKKHLIILTDGKLPDGSYNANYYLQLISELRLSGVTVSVFLMGDASDSLLRKIAEKGRGRFYQTRSAGRLPNLFIEDVKKSGSEITKQEKGPYKVSNSDKLNFTPKNIPDLFGFVQTKLKTNSENPLNIKKGKKNYPLLSFRNYKKGRTGAFTSDLNSRWSKRWFSWDYLLNFTKYLFKNLGLNAGKQSNLDFNFNFVTLNGNGTLNLNIFSEYNSDDLEIKIKNKELRELNFKLVKNSKGSYKLLIKDITPGLYSLNLKYKNNKEIISYFYSNKSDSFDVIGKGVNREVLLEIANKTNALVNPKASDLYLNNLTNKFEQENSTKTSDYNYFFILIALLLVVIELIYRKLLKK